MKPHLEMKINWPRYEEYVNACASQRSWTEMLWEMVKPLKFPNRRRREDREIPKAA